MSLKGLSGHDNHATRGRMVNDGYKYLLNKPVLWFAPGLAIMLVVFAFMIMGYALRDTLYPRFIGIL